MENSKFKSARIWTKEQNEVFIKLYQSDILVKELSKILNKSVEKLHKRARHFGLKRSPNARKLTALNAAKTGKDNKDWIGYEEISGDYICKIRNGARNRNISAPLTDGSIESYKYLWRLFIEQNRKCFLSGEEITFFDKKLNTKQTASLDRIDSSKGYVIGNVQWVHKDVNRAKWEFSQERFILMCNQIAKLHPRN